MRLWEKAGYGSAETGIVAAEVMIQLYLLKFYTSVIGLAPSLAGLALALAVVWDAVSDPLMGHISDHSTFSGGKRRIYILVGALLLSLTFPTMFITFEIAGQWQLFSYLLVSYLLVNTATTIISVP